MKSFASALLKTIVLPPATFSRIAFSNFIGLLAFWINPASYRRHQLVECALHINSPNFAGDTEDFLAH